MEKGFIVASSMPGVTLKDMVLAGMVDPSTSKLNNLATGRLMSIQEAIDSGFIDPNISRVKDPKTNKLISLNDAIASGLIDPDANKVTNPKTGKLISLKAALDRGLLIDVTRPTIKPQGSVGDQPLSPGHGYRH